MAVSRPQTYEILRKYYAEAMVQLPQAEIQSRINRAVGSLGQEVDRQIADLYYDEGVLAAPTIDSKHLIDTTPQICAHCHGDTSIRNPEGYCDHLRYPEYCRVCKRMQREEVKVNA